MNRTMLPTISVVIATHNSSRTIGRCLQSIRDQKYPQERIEIIIADGASSDTTRDITSSYRVRWAPIEQAKQNAEYNKATGIAAARNEILAMIDHDNVLPHPLWFKNMVAPFLEHKEVVGVETLRYHYDPEASLIDRYFALFGAGDPLVWYLGKADRLSYIYDSYRTSRDVEDHGRYYIVRFKPESMPTIGANGFLVRRHILMKYAKTSPGLYFDMDVNVDLIMNGFNTYAFVKDSILHLTGYGSVWYFLKRRMLFIGQYQRGRDKTSDKPVRRYGILSTKGIFQLGLSILICATIVIPLIDSLRGFRKIRDIAWFLHPFLSFSFVGLYSCVIIQYQITFYAKRFLAK